MLSLRMVHDRLDQVHPILTAAHQGSVERLRTIPAESAAAMNAIERANFLHAQIRDLVGVGVESLANVHVTEWDVDTIAVGSDLLVRFSFIGNGPVKRHTTQQKLLGGQEYTTETLEVLALAGIDGPPTTVTCGYTLDGMELGRVEIRRDCKHYLPWSYDIYGGAAVEEPLVLDLTDEPRPATVRSKRSKNHEPRTDSGDGR